ncbi:MAG: glycosyltransferase [Planctomycetota bacterium]|nr:MAG: glycosyltransferase [Planctomycetota bacterium]
MAYENFMHIGASIGGALSSMGNMRGEVILIHCARDDADRFVARKFPRVRVLARAGNLGVGRGNNHLAAHAHGEYVLLLSRDTAPRSNEVALAATRIRDLVRSHHRHDSRCEKWRAPERESSLQHVARQCDVHAQAPRSDRDGVRMRLHAVARSDSIDLRTHASAPE